jgi:hypothetical protein
LSKPDLKHLSLSEIGTQVGCKIALLAVSTVADHPFSYQRMCPDFLLSNGKHHSLRTEKPVPIEVTTRNIFFVGSLVRVANQIGAFRGLADLQLGPSQTGYKVYIVI